MAPKKTWWDKPLRAQCDQHLGWLLGDMLLDRVPLTMIEVVTRENTAAIIEEFMAIHGGVIQGAIAEVEARGLTPTSLTEVVDLVFPRVLVFAKEGAPFLDKPLSPYAGLPQRKEG